MAFISRTIYLITWQGPEWNDPVVCMASKVEADTHAANLNAVKEKSPKLCGRAFPALSKYVVTPVVLTEVV